ncbi:MAG: sigma-54 dependent transcriptional regulator, partial [Mariprofundaceae bacterium]|nr:sigma-54 dependent transcriptional regulator [Mariprofundaceae bacterium]
MNNRILIVDDEEAIRDALQGLLEDEEYQVDCAASGEEAVARFRKHPAGCVLLDIWMPGIDGLETLARLKSMDADVPVIMMSGHATIDTAVRATRQGAFDFVEKPLSTDRMLILIRNALEKRKLSTENQELNEELKQQSEHSEAQDLIGSSSVIEGVRKLIHQVAGADASVLLLGEHGTGKAVVARLLHQYSKRAEAPFVAINTAGIAESRMDSELFGHEKGAFPGALHMQRGRFEMANSGSLFFDELTDLSPGAQAKVLRVLQEHAVQRIGGAAPVNVDVRLIAACGHDPEQALRDGCLREDLYYRLNVVTIHMPSLRERPEDIPLLVESLAHEQAERLSGEAVDFTDDAMAILQSCRWSGNVRELRNYIERCHILRQGEQ